MIAVGMAVLGDDRNAGRRTNDLATFTLNDVMSAESPAFVILAAESARTTRAQSDLMEFGKTAAATVRSIHQKT